jgi:hypothetical protein
MARSITQLEAVLLPFGQDGLLAVGNDGTLWSALNNWKDQLTWVELPSLPAGRLIQSITLTSNWSSANCYALATDGTIWGIQNITQPGATWVQGGNIPQT